MKAKITTKQIAMLKPGMRVELEIDKSPGEIGEIITLEGTAIRKLISMREDWAGIQLGEKFRISTGEKTIELEVVGE